MLNIDTLIRFEQGETSPHETLDLFAELIESGQAWSLQGFYGRYAATLIDNGYITEDGEITDAGREAADIAEEVT